MENTDLQTRKDNFEKELKDLQQKYQLEMSIKLHFPIYNQLPEEVQLALAVIGKHGVQFLSVYTDTKFPIPDPQPAPDPVTPTTEGA